MTKNSPPHSGIAADRTTAEPYGGGIKEKAAAANRDINRVLRDCIKTAPFANNSKKGRLLT